MAAVPAVVKDIKILAGHYDACEPNSSKQLRAVIYVTNGATQVAGGTDTLDVNVGTALAQLRNGATVTLRSWAVYQKGQDGTDAFGATGTVSSNVISLTPELESNWTTDDTIAASTMTVPYGIFVNVDLT